MLSKEDRKALTNWARILPDIFTESSEKHRMKGSEILEWNTITEIDGEKIDPDKFYMYGSPLQIAANHYRRLKRAWKSNGQEGLTAYFKHVAAIVAAHEKENA